MTITGALQSLGRRVLSVNINTATFAIAVPVVGAMLLGLFTPAGPVVMVGANLLAVALILTVVGALIGPLILL